MEVFEEYIAQIGDTHHRTRIIEVLSWVAKTYPALVPKLAWNQPMFTDHGTFIIGFSASKKHLAVAPEQAGMHHVAEDIARAGYDRTKELVRFPWDRPVDYSLLEKMIEFNIADKADCTTFWRK
ncbi:MAG TPA: iron chaperone [Paenibacillus sp.]|nr:iron chaperone [Paenibacillus sp.]